MTRPRAKGTGARCPGGAGADDTVLVAHNEVNIVE